MKVAWSVWRCGEKCGRQSLREVCFVECWRRKIFEVYEVGEKNVKVVVWARKVSGKLKQKIYLKLEFEVSWSVGRWWEKSRGRSLGEISFGESWRRKIFEVVVWYFLKWTKMESKMWSSAFDREKFRWKLKWMKMERKMWRLGFDRD